LPVVVERVELTGVGTQARAAREDWVAPVAPVGPVAAVALVDPAAAVALVDPVAAVAPVDPVAHGPSVLLIREILRRSQSIRRADFTLATTVRPQEKSGTLIRMAIPGWSTQ